MRVLIVNGSHRKGNTYRFVGELMSVLVGKNITVDVVNLIDDRFSICDGCLSCEKTGVCHIDDTFTKNIIPKLINADMYVFAMPVYFNSVPALFKNYIDRTNCLYSYYQENSKKVAVFLVGQLEIEEGSFDSVMKYLSEYAAIMNFDMMKNNIIVTAREPDELRFNEDYIDIIDTWL